MNSFIVDITEINEVIENVLRIKRSSEV